MEPNLPDIFQYIDYRMYLAEAFNAKKKAVRGFSYRTFAARAAASPSLLKDVIQGRRNLTVPVAEKFGSALGLDGKARLYLAMMAEFGNAKRAKEKNAAFEQLVRLRRQAKLTIVDASQHAFWSQWHHPVIRELVTVQGFQEDPNWISEHVTPRISPSQAKQSIDLLLKWGFLRRNLRGRLVHSDPAFTTEYESPGMVVRQFNQEMIALGMTAPDRFPPARREISGLTLGLSETSYERIKERIRSFKEEILDLILEDKAPTRLVCQLNVQLFPFLEDAP
jgi:uncharacterized protein (TIGR02147 family)